jgi:hypothetical protein
MIRNRKAVVGGFMPRVAAVWPVEMTEAEWSAYHAIGEYVRSGYARSQAIRSNALGFLMSTFQKLSSSSWYALRQSLLRRIERLESGLVTSTGQMAAFEEDDLEELPVADALGEGLGTRYRDSVADEVRELARLVELIDVVELDSKARVLLERLAELIEHDPAIKLIVFTQSRDTQAFLSTIVGPPWQVNLFHGQLKPDEKDLAVATFREGRGPQLLISTEAGGEGRNFQFCHTLINYDLPWNPMRVEQRIGRLDRIGQKHPVTVINFSITGTIEERVLEVLTERIRLFEETIGGLDPILGDVEEDLKAIFMASEAEAEKALQRLDRQLAIRVQAAREAERKLADLIMDTKSFRQDEVAKLLEHRSALDSETIRRFVIVALSELGASIEDDPELAHVYRITFKGQFLNELPHFVHEGVLRRVTFNPAVALDHEDIDFLAMGHALVDALINRVLARNYEGRTSHRIVRTDDQAPISGWFLTFALELDGVLSAREVFPVFVDATGTSRPDLASWLLDRAALGKREQFADPNPPDWGPALDHAVAISQQLALQRLMGRQSEMAEANRSRLDQERSKLERYYDYRARVAAEKLASVRTVFERVSASDDPDIQRIIPVWAKNLENAKAVLEGLTTERGRRLGELNGKEQVTAQQQLLTVSYVEIVPANT